MCDPLLQFGLIAFTQKNENKIRQGEHTFNTS